MSFDICIGFGEAQLDALAAGIHARVYPQLFTGARTLDVLGERVEVRYDAKRPPTFDLAPLAADVLRGVLAAVHAEHAGASLSSDPAGTQPLERAVAAARPGSFSLRLAAVRIAVSGADPLAVDIQAYCTLKASAGALALDVHDIALDACDTGPVGQYILEHFIKPQMLVIVGDLLAGFALPVPTIPGVPPGRSLGVVADRRMLVLTSIAGDGAPSVEPDMRYPDRPFFVQMRKPALQAAVADAIGRSNTFAGGADQSKGWGPFKVGVRYRYAFRLNRPLVDVSPPGLAIRFSLDGSVSGGADLVLSSVDLVFDVALVPPPVAFVELKPAGRELRIVTRGLSDFRVDVTPGGNIVQKLAGWMIAFVVQGVANSLAPQIRAWMLGIDFPGLRIPAYTQTIAGVALTFAPSGIDVLPAGDSVYVGGTLAVA
ncbi:hypothetical protein AQ837_22140 [Burkholderia pseudomallei]|uniref:hypothetical protein n=1 Tax=Burkholderia pseudomallei TaxID=28450 RepID=UPI0003D8D42D|nr:hypothetical protein [Burkholderia pseudomallei]AHE32872.1 hypothetical protein BBS_906 [Burkholderia pseudomallei NAU20B-16]AHG33619.1 hypothetical protein BBQ_2840 [Burkholderia pseudomallei MSHR511]AHG67931.1 hypothetical protein BBN_2964 [Burkholderia pseudomallei MSHR146]OMX08942.1 hypothetical protein AQ819_30915 [Burkholderia pseudomallei]OMY01848.1 hypothetical protein AQ837_22140 [Burkholderia pseudomallei]